MASVAVDEEHTYTNVERNIQEPCSQYEELSHNPKPLQTRRVPRINKWYKRRRCWNWALGIALATLATLITTLVSILLYQAHLHGWNTLPPTVPASSPMEDGCPRQGGGTWEVFHESCYYFETVRRMTWDGALRACSSMGASLVSIHSGDENEFVYQKLTEKNSAVYGAWTGLCRSEHNTKRWHWSDFSPLDYKNWGPNEPNNAGGTEACVELCVTHATNRKRWNDGTCDSIRNYVCKAPKQNSKLPSVTPPPMEEGSCPRGARWEEFSEACYYFETENGMTWGEATRKCITKGASLLSIHTMQEGHFIYKTLMKKNGNPFHVWTGLIRSDIDREWCWSDLSAVDYMIWAPHEPNNGGGNEDCMVIQASKVTWNDVQCTTTTFKYVCKAPKR